MKIETTSFKALSGMQPTGCLYFFQAGHPMAFRYQETPLAWRARMIEDHLGQPGTARWAWRALLRKALQKSGTLTIAAHSSSEANALVSLLTACLAKVDQAKLATFEEGEPK